MGYVPLPYYRQLHEDGSATLHYGEYHSELRRRVDRWRFSRFPWRRRAAHRACLELIRRNEIELSGGPRPPDKPSTL